MGFKVAVVGATGNVGREMLAILAERSFPADEVVRARLPPEPGRRGLVRRPHAEVQGAGAPGLLRRRHLPDVGRLGACRRNGRPRSRAAGAVVIDNSSCWRYDSDVPLIVPEVNADAIAGFRKRGIIANPNCSTAQLVVALKPLHDKATHQARRGRDLSVGVGRRQGRHGRARPPDQGDLLAAGDRGEEVSQAHRLQRHPAHRRVHGGRLPRKKSGRWWSRPRKSSTPRSS